MEILRTHGGSLGASAIRPEQISAVAAEVDPAQAMRSDLWLSDLHGLGIANIRGQGVFEMLKRTYGRSVGDIGNLLRLDRAWIAGLAADEALLLTADAGDVSGVIEALSSEQAGSLVTVTDVTHGRCALAVGGPQAQRVLARLTGLDLRAMSFPPGSAAQTSVAKVHTLLLRADIREVPAYLALVGRSVGAYLWDVLVDVSEAEGISAVNGIDLRETWLSS